MGHRYQTVTWDKMWPADLSDKYGSLHRLCRKSHLLHRKGVAPLRVVKSSGLAGFAWTWEVVTRWWSQHMIARTVVLKRWFFDPAHSYRVQSNIVSPHCASTCKFTRRILTQRWPHLLSNYNLMPWVFAMAWPLVRAAAGFSVGVVHRKARVR